MLVHSLLPTTSKEHRWVAFGVKVKKQSQCVLDLFVAQTRKLKPVICSSYQDQYHGTWLKSNNEFTIQNYSAHKLDSNNRPYSYASGKWQNSRCSVPLLIDLISSFVEDSQGNINPYAVTGCALNCKDHADHGTFWRDNKHTHCLLDTLGKKQLLIGIEKWRHREWSLVNQTDRI